MLGPGGCQHNEVRMEMKWRIITYHGVPDANSLPETVARVGDG